MLGEQKYIAYWEDIVQKNATGEMKGNAQILQFYLKNRISSLYKDRHEVEHSAGGSIQVITNVPYREITDDSMVLNSSELQAERSESLDIL